MPDIPPQDQAFEVVNALVIRIRQLIKSAELLKTTDVRTAFFLAVIAVEEVMKGLILWSFGTGILSANTTSTLLSTQSHRTKQQLAVGITKIFEGVYPLMTKVRHKKDFYSAKALASKHTKAVVNSLGSEVTMKKLGYWESTKQACLYVDWKPGENLTNSPVSESQVEAIIALAAGYLEWLKIFNTRKNRRTFSRHQREFQALADEIRALAPDE